MADYNESGTREMSMGDIANSEDDVFERAPDEELE